MSKPLFSIGPSKETVKEARAAIMDILRAKVDQDVMKIALETLRGITSVNNAVVSGNTFMNQENPDE